MADLILVNKADGDLKPAATRTMADYAGALRFLRKRAQDPDGFPKAMAVSALEESGLAKAWDEMNALVDWRRSEGFFAVMRAEQARFWFEEDVRMALLAQLDRRDAAHEMKRLGGEVARGETAPAVAAAQMVSVLRES